MKKYFLIASIFLLAAGCAKPTPVVVIPPQPVFDGRLQIDSPKEGDTLENTFTITGIII